jgi:predicted acyltransferase
MTLPVVESARPRRLLSLDAFRGMTIAGMILVNNPGTWASIYPPLEHAEWHGWTPTDLIFPFFLFIVGVAMAFSFSQRKTQGQSRSRLTLHIIVRSAAMFGLGMLLTGIPDFDFSHRLILDVLQRIGVVYLVSALIILYSSRFVQGFLAGFFLIVYWVLMFAIPVPGYGAGVLAPEGNVWSYVDTLLLSTWHYHAEGILSLIPSFSTVLLGQLAGQWLRSEKTNEQKVNGLFVLGNVGLCVGLILDQWFPINKLLWSSSYVLFTAGFAMNILAIVYWMIEIHGWTRWFLPMVALGMNAIAAFFLSSLTARILGLVSVGTVGPDGVAAKISLKGWLYSTLFSPWLSAVNASLAYAVCYALLWTGLMWILYKKKVFIKL